jgi:hypothetical protein
MPQQEMTNYYLNSVRYREVIGQKCLDAKGGLTNYGTTKLILVITAYNFRGNSSRFIIFFYLGHDSHFILL